VSYDREGLLSVLCPSVAFLVARIYDYFGFGFYYVSMYVKEIWGRDLTSFSAGLLPFGMKTLGVSDIREQMRAVVDMGARWHPDVALLMWNLGFLGLSGKVRSYSTQWWSGHLCHELLDSRGDAVVAGWKLHYCFELQSANRAVDRSLLALDAGAARNSEQTSDRMN
jgi:hypothetical protein